MGRSNSGCTAPSSLHPPLLALAFMVGCADPGDSDNPFATASGWEPGGSASGGDGDTDRDGDDDDDDSGSPRPDAGDASGGGASGGGPSGGGDSGGDGDSGGSTTGNGSGGDGDDSGPITGGGTSTTGGSTTTGGGSASGGSGAGTTGGGQTGSCPADPGERPLEGQYSCCSAEGMVVTGCALEPNTLCVNVTQTGLGFCTHAACNDPAVDCDPAFGSGSASVTCVDAGGASFCALDCSVGTCPVGMACQEVAVVQGAPPALLCM